MVFRSRKVSLKSLGQVLRRQAIDETPEAWAAGAKTEDPVKILGVPREYRCFRFGGTGAEIAEYFEDLIHPYIEGNRKSGSIVYPVYISEVKFTKATFFVACFPYSLLAEDIMNQLESIEYCRIKIAELLRFMHLDLLDSPRELIQDKSNIQSRRARAILRSGRFPLIVKNETNSSDAKSSREKDWLDNVILVGKDVMRSSLYQRLISGQADGQKYEFSGSLARVTFEQGKTSMVSTKIDRRGNFSFRPGNRGCNLLALVEFLSFCERNDLIEFGAFSPFDQPIDFVP